MKHKIGLEIEMELNKSGYDWEDVYDLASDITGDYAFLRGSNVQEDGSLDEELGIEVSTPILTREEIVSDDMKKYLDRLVEAGFRSHDARSCGLHMHFDMERYLGEDLVVANERLAKIIVFFREYDSWLATFCRRTRRTWCGKMSIYEQTLDQLKDGVLNYNYDSDVYSKVGFLADNTNITNRNAVSYSGCYETIEFRLGRGTLNHTTIVAMMDLWLHILAKSATVTWAQSTNFDAWMADAPQNVVDYALSRKLTF